MVSLYKLESEYMSQSKPQLLQSQTHTDPTPKIQQQPAWQKLNNNQNQAEPLNEINTETQLNGNNCFTYQYEHIADRMLRQLEDEYWEVHKHNIGPTQEQQAQQQNNNKEYEDEDEKDKDDDDEEEDDGQVREGYINLDNDDGDHNLNSENEDSQDDCENEQQDGHVQATVQIKQATIINTDISNIQQFVSAQSINPETKELVEVGPVPDQIFNVPEPTQSGLTEIECGKIKSFALSLDIQAPEWANDPIKIQQKIRKLFQKPASSKQSLPGLSNFTK